MTKYIINYAGHESVGRMISYKEESLKNGNRKTVIEFLVDQCIEHEHIEELNMTNPSFIEDPVNSLRCGQHILKAISYLNTIIHTKKKEKDFIYKIINSDAINFIIPYVHIKIEYKQLKPTLQILIMLTGEDLNQPEFSPFQNKQFAENITEIIADSSGQLAIREMSFKLVNNLLLDEIIGREVFLNLIGARFPSAILKSDIFLTDVPMDIIEKKRLNYFYSLFKINKKASAVLCRIAEYCNVEYLNLFAPFFPTIIRFLTYQHPPIQTKFHKEEVDIKKAISNTKLNFLYLLSIILQNEANRSFAYNCRVPEIIMEYLRTEKGDFIIHSLNSISEMISNDGIQEIFRSFAFYNLVRNSLQNARKNEIVIAIYRTINALIPIDWENLLTNDIISDVFDSMVMDTFKNRVDSALLILHFFECCTNADYCLQLINDSYLANICIVISCFSCEEQIYFIKVIENLLSKSVALSDLIVNIQEVVDTIQELTQNVDEVVSIAATNIQQYIEQSHHY